MRGDGGAGAVGGRQERDHPAVSVVPGGVGEADVVAGGGDGVPHDLAYRLPGSGDGGAWGRAHLKLDGIQALGIDEMPYGRLAEILRHNLRAVRAYLHKEEFQLFWEYESLWWAGRFLDSWCEKTMRSRIEPMKRGARMVRSHRELIGYWFRARKALFSGVLEILNNNAKLTMKKAYSYKSIHTLEIALYHTLGNLPESKFTHSFFG